MAKRVNFLPTPQYRALLYKWFEHQPSLLCAVGAVLTQRGTLGTPRDKTACLRAKISGEYCLART